LAAQNRGLRESELLHAEEIVDGELRALLLDLRERASVPVLGQLRAHAQALAEAEAARTLSQLGPVSERHQKSVRAMAAAIVNKLLHAPTQALRSEAGQGPLAQAAARLFGLEGEARPEAGDPSGEDDVREGEGGQAGKGNEAGDASGEDDAREGAGGHAAKSSEAAGRR
jgi:hypothetical protein